MLLSPDAREFWTVTVNTTPPAQAVEASFATGGDDDWVAGHMVSEGTWRWLVRGPEVEDDPARPAHLVPATVVPRIRIVDEPEIVVRRVHEAPIVVRH